MAYGLCGVLSWKALNRNCKCWKSQSIFFHATSNHSNLNIFHYDALWQNNVSILSRNSKHDLVRVRVTRFSFATKDAKYIQISQFCEHGLAQSVPAPERSWLQTWRSGLRPRLIHVFSATKVMPVPMNCKAFWPDIWPEASSGGQRGITSRMILERCHVEHDMWCRESLLCLATPVHRAHTSKPTKLPGFLVTLLSVNYLLIAWTMKIMKIHVPFAQIYHGRNVF